MHCTKQISTTVPILLKGRVEKQPAQITLLALTEHRVKSGLLRSPCSALIYIERKIKTLSLEAPFPRSPSRSPGKVRVPGGGVDPPAGGRWGTMLPRRGDPHESSVTEGLCNADAELHSLTLDVEGRDICSPLSVPSCPLVLRSLAASFRLLSSW